MPSGKGAGEPFHLIEFERDFIRAVYEPMDDDGRRLVRRAVLSIARKNGKTALIAALVLTHLVGPEAIRNGEIYSAANEREQAGQVFKVAAQIVRADPELLSLLKVVDSTKTIVCLHNGSFYRAVSAQAGSKHGLNPSLVIYDELAQSKTRELYDVLDTSMGARVEPLFVAISTQSNDSLHILSELIDDGLSGEDPSTVTRLYAVPDEVEDVFDPAVWAAANPALGVFRSENDLQVMADRARRMPSFEATFRNLYLNQRVNPQSPLIPGSEWKACMHKSCRIEPGERIYLGLDLSARTDLTALVAVSAEDGDRLAAWFWKPQDLLAEHDKRDRAHYSDWVREGYIEACPGRSIDYGYVAERIAEINAEHDIAGLAFDRWRVDLLLKELSAIGLSSWVDGKDRDFTEDLRIVPFGQGYRDMAPAIDEIEASVIERNLQHDGNPVLSMCFSNAIAVSDPAGNRKLDKSLSRFRIDGAVAAAMALGLKGRDRKEIVVSPYDDPEYRMSVL